jgi:hypothetical protein
MHIKAVSSPINQNCHHEAACMPDRDHIKSKLLESSLLSLKPDADSIDAKLTEPSSRPMKEKLYNVFHAMSTVAAIPCLFNIIFGFSHPEFDKGGTVSLSTNEKIKWGIRIVLGILCLPLTFVISIVLLPISLIGAIGKFIVSKF